MILVPLASKARLDKLGRKVMLVPLVPKARLGRLGRKVILVSEVRRGQKVKWVA